MEKQNTNLYTQCSNFRTWLQIISHFCHQEGRSKTHLPESGRAWDCFNQQTVEEVMSYDPWHWVLSCHVRSQTTLRVLQWRSHMKALWWTIPVESSPCHRWVGKPSWNWTMQPKLFLSSLIWGFLPEDPATVEHWKADPPMSFLNF